MVRQRSAKPLFTGSIPVAASPSKIRAVTARLARFAIRFTTITAGLVLIALTARLIDPAHAAENKITLDKMICTVGNQVITLEQIEVEKALMAQAQDAIVFHGAEAQMTVEQVFLDLVVRTLLRQQAIRMGFTDVDEKAVDEQIARFRASFGSADAYKEFLRRYQLDDENVENLAPEGEIFTDLRYRFRVLTMVNEMVNKKLDLQVKLAAQEELGVGGVTEPGSETNDDPAVQAVRTRIRDEKLKEWIKDLASRTTITVTDENYRPGLDHFLGRKSVTAP